MRYLIPLLSILSVMLGNTAHGASRRHPDSGKNKFIPTYAILYGSGAGARPLAETAKFDVMVVDRWSRSNAVWQAETADPYVRLKQLNPNIVILAYQLGAAQYNTAAGNELIDGWPWMQTNHGVASPERWTAKGVTYGCHLKSTVYTNVRLMDIGIPAWREYWNASTYTQFWDPASSMAFRVRGTDGVFSDVTNFNLPNADKWVCEDGPVGTTDHPLGYYTTPSGPYRHDLWKPGVQSFIANAVSYLGARDKTFTHNFERVGVYANWWRELDALPEPPFAAMDEEGFISKDGTTQLGSFKIWNWTPRVQGMRTIHKVRILMNQRATPPAGTGTGLAMMNRADAIGMTGWDALWIAMSSFLMGFDDVNRNGYMNFTLWAYNGYFWFDEFDPQYLHLGRALGEPYSSGGVWIREYQDGFVVVNPTVPTPGNPNPAPIRVVSPAPNVRVINHANFKTPDAAPMVMEFDLPAKRGVILLKNGRKIGNQDNPVAANPGAPPTVRR